MIVYNGDRDGEKGRVSLANPNVDWFQMCVYIPTTPSNNMFPINTMM